MCMSCTLCTPETFKKCLFYVIGLKLRGKDKGQPLGQKGKKWASSDLCLVLFCFFLSLVSFCVFVFVFFLKYFIAAQCEAMSSLHIPLYNQNNVHSSQNGYFQYYYWNFLFTLQCIVSFILEEIYFFLFIFVVINCFLFVLNFMNWR